MEIVFFLLLIVPGILANVIYNVVSRLKETSTWYSSLIFSFFIYFVNIIILFFIEDIFTLTALLASFDCLQFTRNYIILSTVVAAIMGAGAGIVRWFFPFIRR